MYLENKKLSAKKEFTVHFKNDHEEGTRKLFLGKLLPYDAHAIAALIDQLIVQNTGDIIQKATAIKDEAEKIHFQMKVCSVILHDKEGIKYPEEFYMSCSGEDLHKAVDYFFNNEGFPLLEKVSSYLITPLAEKSQDPNLKIILN
jgi:hypothetical protein